MCEIYEGVKKVIYIGVVCGLYRERMKTVIFVYRSEKQVYKQRGRRSLGRCKKDRVVE